MRAIDYVEAFDNVEVASGWLTDDPMAIILQATSFSDRDLISGAAFMARSTFSSSIRACLAAR